MPSVQRSHTDTPRCLLPLASLLPPAPPSHPPTLPPCSSGIARVLWRPQLRDPGAGVQRQPRVGGCGRELWPSRGHQRAALTKLGDGHQRHRQRRPARHGYNEVMHLTLLWHPSPFQNGANVM